jgi:hypothetical protein
LAVHEVGEPEALKDLIGRLGQGWRSELADPDGRGIRVGFLSQLPLDRIDQVREFLPPLRPIQVDDIDTTISQMGRPALHVQVELAGRPLGSGFVSSEVQAAHLPRRPVLAPR